MSDTVTVPHFDIRKPVIPVPGLNFAVSVIRSYRSDQMVKDHMDAVFKIGPGKKPEIAGKIPGTGKFENIINGRENEFKENKKQKPQNIGQQQDKQVGHSGYHGLPEKRHHLRDKRIVFPPVYKTGEYTAGVYQL